MRCCPPRTTTWATFPRAHHNSHALGVRRLKQHRWHGGGCEAGPSRFTNPTLAGARAVCARRSLTGAISRYFILTKARRCGLLLALFDGANCGEVGAGSWGGPQEGGRWSDGRRRRFLSSALYDRSAEVHGSVYCSETHKKCIY